MRVRLAVNNYGKSRVRLIQVTRHRDRHDLKDISVDIQLEGGFEEAHTRGDNRKVLPTDTMKNTVYALAKRHPVDQIEDFAARLAAHILGGNPQVTIAQVSVVENLWSRVPAGKKLDPWTFMRTSQEKRTTSVSSTRKQIRIQSGLDDLLVLKTSGSAFAGFIRDAYTTLKETHDRLMATIIRARWTYDREHLDFGASWNQVRKAILRTFANHQSRSVQHTLYAMGEAVLRSHKEITEIRLSLPNQHCLLVDLGPFGLKNENEIFVPTDEPHGLIEATLRRD